MPTASSPEFPAAAAAILAALAALFLAALGFAAFLLARARARLLSLRRENAALARENLEQARNFSAVSAEMESFSASVSHDLRAPIRVADGFARILLEDYGSRMDEIGRGHLRRILAAAERMNAMIDALLAMSRRTAGDVELAVVDLSRVAREIAQELQATEGAMRTRFEIVPEAIATADPALARMVLQNLLANACKFSSRAGQPVVEFGREALEGGSGWFVRDNGAGFDMRFAARLFEPFQRLHPQDEYPGTGVGLATVARAIRRHGGRIWAEAEPGKGACFHFTLQPTSTRRPAAAAK
jgi:signal transduction histidine kinase